MLSALLSAKSRTTARLILIAAVCASLASAQDDSYRMNAPGVAPDSILYYKPQTAGNVILGVLYGLVSIGLWYHLTSRRDWWALCLPIGTTLQCIGFFLRLPLATHPANLGLYIVQTFFVVISPCALFAFSYIAFGRFSYNLQHDTTIQKRSPKVTLLNPLLFGRIFILSDVATFLIQASGGSMEVSASLSGIGSKIFLIGIIAQGVSYGIFMVCAIYTHWVVSADGAEQHPLHRNIQKLFWVLHVAGVWIIVRSVYRIIELAQGFRGFLFTHEIYFFLLDSLPLILFNLTWVFFWPTRLVPLKRSESGFQEYDHEYPLYHSQKPALRPSSSTDL